jgi:hypothetical protein
MPPAMMDLSNARFREAIIVGAACLMAVIAGFWLADEAYLFFAIATTALYLGTLAINAKIFAWLLIALQPAALIVPFLPGRPFVWELCALLSWPSLAVWFIINWRRFKELRLDGLEVRAMLAVVAYIIVLIVLMMTRGMAATRWVGAFISSRSSSR